MKEKDDTDFTWKPKMGNPRAEETTEKFTITIQSTTLGNGDYNGDLIEAYILEGWYLSLRLYIYIIERKEIVTL